MDLSFAVHKLAKVSANPGKLHFEGLVHLLRYIRDNKTLGLKYYIDLNDAPVTDLLRQANIKTNNHLMDFSDSALHKLARFSANPGKVQFEGLMHLLRYIRENKTLGLKYYADLNDAPVTDILRKANIKINNNLMAFSDSS